MNVFNYDFIGGDDLKLTADTKLEFIPKITAEDYEMERAIQVCEPCCKVLQGKMALDYHRDSIGHMEKMEKVKQKAQPHYAEMDGIFQQLDIRRGAFR